MASTVLDYDFIDNLEQAKLKIGEFEGEKELSLDCEGMALSRTGQLCILQIATGARVYVFDVHVLGKELFNTGWFGYLFEVFYHEHIVKMYLHMQTL